MDREGGRAHRVRGRRVAYVADHGAPSCTARGTTVSGTSNEIHDPVPVRSRAGRLHQGSASGALAGVRDQAIERTQLCASTSSAEPHGAPARSRRNTTSTRHRRRDTYRCGRNLRPARAPQGGAVVLGDRGEHGADRAGRERPVDQRGHRLCRIAGARWQGRSCSRSRRHHARPAPRSRSTSGRRAPAASGAAVGGGLRDRSWSTRRGR